MESVQRQNVASNIGFTNVLVFSQLVMSGKVKLRDIIWMEGVISKSILTRKEEQMSINYTSEPTLAYQLPSLKLEIYQLWDSVLTPGS